jgi:hypothetical protein
LVKGWHKTQIQRLTDDLAICASIVFAEEWAMLALEECAASEPICR